MEQSDTLVIKHGMVLLPGAALHEADVLIEQGIIGAIGKGLTAENEIDASGCTVLPGLIDLHTHGIGYVSTDEGSLEEYARLEASRGTTTFYPTLFGPPETTVKNLARLLGETDNLRTTPQVAGFRRESPYLARTGAGVQKDLAPISHELTAMLLKAGGGYIKIWDVSPERIAFVTDSNYGAGLAPGRYTLPGSWGVVAIDGPNNGVRMVDRDMGLA